MIKNGFKSGKSVHGDMLKKKKKSKATKEVLQLESLSNHSGSKMFSGEYF